MDSLESLAERVGKLVRKTGELAQAIRTDRHQVHTKSDGSVVTDADREVECLLRQELPALVRGTTVWGEEFGWSPQGSGGLWLVDPIDGTTNYALGSPLWGISVALYAKGSLQLGALYLPDLGEMYLGYKGGGATLNDRPLPAIPPGSIEKRELVGYCEAVVNASKGIRWPGRQRCAGAFVVEAAFVATQRYRGMVGMREKLYDVAAALVIAEELGAEVEYVDGAQFSVSDLLEDRKIGRLWTIFPRGHGFSAER